MGCLPWWACNSWWVFDLKRSHAAQQSRQEHMYHKFSHPSPLQRTLSGYIQKALSSALLLHLSWFLKSEVTPSSILCQMFNQNERGTALELIQTQQTVPQFIRSTRRCEVPLFTRELMPACLHSMFLNLCWSPRQPADLLPPNEKQTQYYTLSPGVHPTRAHQRHTTG